MRKPTVALLVLSVLLLVPLQTAWAFRCGARLVSIGDTRREVLDKCGSPTWVDSWVEDRVFRGSGRAMIDKGRNFTYQVPVRTIVQVTIEEWTYNPGPTQFIRILRFENSRLIEIETGEYGY